MYFSFIKKFTLKITKIESNLLLWLSYKPKERRLEEEEKVKGRVVFMQNAKNRSRGFRKFWINLIRWESKWFYNSSNDELSITDDLIDR